MQRENSHGVGHLLVSPAAVFWVIELNDWKRLVIFRIPVPRTSG